MTTALALFVALYIAAAVLLAGYDGWADTLRADGLGPLGRLAVYAIAPAAFPFAVGYHLYRFHARGR